MNAMHEAMRPSLIKRLTGGKVSALDAKAVSASLGAHLCELVQLNTPGKWGSRSFRGVREVVLDSTWQFHGSSAEDRQAVRQWQIRQY